MKETILSVNNLYKKYGDHVAVNDLSFNVYQGDILGFLGPNGAGKSSTINILSTVLPLDSGEVTFFGKNIQTHLNEIKSRIGVVPQNLAIFEDMSAGDNVRFFTSLYGLKGILLDEAVENALRAVGLYERRKDEAKTFSGGMKRRLNIACSIAHQPDLLILDEPTVGIDPQSRNHILESIRKMHEQGTTIIYTTHYMEEVEALCDRIIIMDQGQKIMDGPIESLIGTNGDNEFYEISVNTEINAKVLMEIEMLSGVKSIVAESNKLHMRLFGGEQVVSNVLTVLLKNNINILQVHPRQQTLETYFLELTGKDLRDE